MEKADGHLELHGTRQFVTNGGRVDSYVLCTTQVDGPQDGEITCLVADADAPIEWAAPWQRLGMRGD